MHPGPVVRVTGVDRSREAEERAAGDRAAVPAKCLLAAAEQSLLDLGDVNLRLFAAHRLGETKVPCADLARAWEFDGRRVSGESVRRRIRRTERVLQRHGVFAAADALAMAATASLPMFGSDSDDSFARQAISEAISEAAGEEAPAGTVRFSSAMALSSLVTATRHGVTATMQGQELAERVRHAMLTNCDETGLVLHDRLIEAVPEAAPVLDACLRFSGMSRIGRHLVLKDKRAARMKLALLALGRPATKREIAEAAGLPHASNSAISSYLHATEAAVRYDKTRWALAEQTPEPFRGTVSAMHDYIKANGGQAGLARMCADLSAKYGIRPSSVRTYAWSAPVFAVSSGTVRSVESPTVTPGALADATTVNEDGEPQRLFEVDESHLRGYSFIVPPVVAHALGCPPDGRTEAPVANAGCRPVSVTWSLASIGDGKQGKATIGHVRHALAAIGAQPGDTARLVIQDDGAVRFEKES